MKNNAMNINKSKIQLYRYMQLCYGSSISTVKYCNTESFGEVVAFTFNNVAADTNAESIDLETLIGMIIVVN